MQISERISQLVRPGQYLTFRQKSRVLTGFEHQRAQVFARHKIHHQIITSINGKEIRNFGQIGMIQARQDGCFTQELVPGLLDHVLRHAAVMLNFFERAKTAFQAQIICKINAAHATPSDRSAGPVAAAENFSRFQRRRHRLLLSHTRLE